MPKIVPTIIALLGSIFFLPPSALSSATPDADSFRSSSTLSSCARSSRFTFPEATRQDISFSEKYSLSSREVLALREKPTTVTFLTFLSVEYLAKSFAIFL